MNDPRLPAQALAAPRGAVRAGADGFADDLDDGPSVGLVDLLTWLGDAKRAIALACALAAAVAVAVALL